MFIILDYSSALEYSIIRRYTNIVYYYYYYIKLRCSSSKHPETLSSHIIREEMRDTNNVLDVPSPSTIVYYFRFVYNMDYVMPYIVFIHPVKLK